MSGRPPAPTIPLLKNNTIDLEELGSDNLITFALYDNPQDGDALYPSWWGRTAAGEPADYGNGDISPVYYDGAIADPVFGMPMEIDNRLVHRLVMGEVFYSYLLERYSETKVESYRVAFNVGKRDLLSAPQIKESHDEYLDARGPEDLLTLVVPPYRAMAKDDKVTLRWEGERWNGSPVTPITRVLNVTDTHVGNVLSWTVPRTNAVAIEGGKVTLSYTIDYALPTLNPRAASATRQIVVDAPTLPKLEKVRIKGFSGSELDPSAFPQGITLLVTPWSGIRSGDILTLYWIGSRVDRTIIKSQQIDLSSLDTGKIEVLIEHDWLSKNQGSTVSVSYQYLRADASGSSETSDLRMLVPLDLRKPTVEGVEVGDATVDGYLDTQFFASTGVTVNIPAEVIIPEGATVTMHWKGFGDPVEITDPVAGNPKKFKVPASAIPANMDRTVEINYSVKLKDAPVDAPASPSKYYYLGVNTIPQHRLGVMDCEGATVGNPGELKRSFVIARDGVRITFNPPTWIYIAETQEIRMWLTGVEGFEEAIIERRNVSPSEVTGGVRGRLLPTHLQSLPDDSDFTIHFSVSFDGGDTATPFKTLPLKLRP